MAAAAFAIHGYTQRPRAFDATGLLAYYSALRVRPAQAADPAALRAGIEAAAGYLRRVNLPSGQFVYVVNMDPAVPVPADYNLLRHAGTIYSLGMAHSVVPDPDTVRVMQRATAFMRECCFDELDDGEMAGISEPPEIVHQPGPLDYKLGGAGLGLVAWTSLETISPGSVPIEDMQRLARFGQFMQKRGGEFYAKYVPSSSGRQLPGGSLYYPGEMALGWLELYELRPSPDLVESAVDALVFLAGTRARDGSAPADHWALLATAKLFELAERDKLEIPRELIFNHALQVCHAILDEGYAPQPLPEMDGALVSRGVVTPTATRLEGLLAALRFVPGGHPMRPHMESAVHRGIDFLLRAQVEDGEFAGALPWAIAKLPGGDPATLKFNDQVGEIRIDYVQHAMSAMVQYLEWTVMGAAVAGNP